MLKNVARKQQGSLAAIGVHLSGLCFAVQALSAALFGMACSPTTSIGSEFQVGDFAILVGLRDGALAHVSAGVVEPGRGFERDSEADYVAFRMVPGDLVDRDGAVHWPGSVRRKQASTGDCHRCRSRLTTRPHVVSAGESCEMPPFATAEGAEQSSEFLDRLRRNVLLDFEGPCADSVTLPSPRGDIAASWTYPPEVFDIELELQHTDGTLLGFSASEIRIWHPGGDTDYLHSLDLDMPLAAVELSGGRTLLAVNDITRPESVRFLEISPDLSIVEIVSDGFAPRPTKMVRASTATDEVLMLGRYGAHFELSVQTLRACRVIGQQVTCSSLTPAEFMVGVDDPENVFPHGGYLAVLAEKGFAFGDGRGWREDTFPFLSPRSQNRAGPHALLDGDELLFCVSADHQIFVYALPMSAETYAHEHLAEALVEVAKLEGDCSGLTPSPDTPGHYWIQSGDSYFELAPEGVRPKRRLPTVERQPLDRILSLVPNWSVYVTKSKGYFVAPRGGTPVPAFGATRSPVEPRILVPTPEGVRARGEAHWLDPVSGTRTEMTPLRGTPTTWLETADGRAFVATTTTGRAFLTRVDPDRWVPVDTPISLPKAVGAVAEVGHVIAAIDATGRVLRIDGADVREARPQWDDPLTTEQETIPRSCLDDPYLWAIDAKDGFGLAVGCRSSIFDLRDDGTELLIERVGLPTSADLTLSSVTMLDRDVALVGGLSESPSGLIGHLYVLKLQPGGLDARASWVLAPNESWVQPLPTEASAGFPTGVVGEGGFGLLVYGSGYQVVGSRDVHRAGTVFTSALWDAEGRRVFMGSSLGWMLVTSRVD